MVFHSSTVGQIFSSAKAKIMCSNSQQSPQATESEDSAAFPMLPSQFIVLDLETTGLSPENGEIIEIGAIRATLGSDTHPTFQTLVKPERGVPEYITDINGITQAMVDTAGIPLDKALAEFIEFIGELPLVSFNAPFDMGFLIRGANKHGFRIKNRYTCALELARRAYPGLPSYRLPYLAKIGNLSDANTHRAVGDCKRTMVIFASAARKIGEQIDWKLPPIDWRVMVKYNEARDANRAFVHETRAFELADPAEAAARYALALERMYEYEKLVDFRFGDDRILDRLTLCLWKTRRYSELVRIVDDFVRSFPDKRSSLMSAVLTRRLKAASRVK